MHNSASGDFGYHSDNLFFDRFTQMDTEFVIFGWVGWLASWPDCAGLGWLVGLGWVGLGPAETTKNT